MTTEDGVSPEREIKTKEEKKPQFKMSLYPKISKHMNKTKKVVNKNL